MSGTTWLMVGGGVLIVVWIATMISLLVTTSRPLPALDRTPRTATVVRVYTPDENDLVEVEYVDDGGARRRADLADMVDASSLDRFQPGTAWQVYAFREPQPVVLLTEAHDDVIRCGYHLNGVRLGGESGPVTVGPGSPFLNGRWKFEE